MGDEKRLGRAKQRILKAFDRADGVDEVIKYDDQTTLYEEICWILEEEVYNEEERDEEEKLEESRRPESQLEREIFGAMEKCYRSRDQLEGAKRRLRRLWEELEGREDRG